MANGQDFYSILGVTKSASVDDIKKAYKKLVVKYHPDKFTDEKEKAAANSKFQEIQEAYDVLKDDKKRKQYDALGHESFKNGASGFGGASGFEGFHGFDFGGSGGFEDIFSEFFSGFGGGAAQQIFKGEDLRFSLEISLEEAFLGYETVIKIPRKVRCSTCFASGNAPGSSPTKCTKCNGSGKIHVQQFIFKVEKPCDRCNGTGLSYKSCSSCRGEGRVNESSSVKISIPKGVEDGMKLHLKGEGNSIKGGVNGDLYIHISVKKHSIFVVDHSNLLITVRISVFDAILGKIVEVLTLDKEKSILNIPSGTQPGAKIYIRGKGMKKFNSEYRGDIVATINVEIPKSISSSEKELWKKLQEDIECIKKKGGFTSFWESFIPNSGK